MVLGGLGDGVPKRWVQGEGHFLLVVLRGQSPASRESPQLREHSGEVIVGYNSGKPSFSPATFPTIDEHDTLLSRFFSLNKTLISFSVLSLSVL